MSGVQADLAVARVMLYVCMYVITRLPVHGLQISYPVRVPAAVSRAEEWTLDLAPYLLALFFYRQLIISTGSSLSGFEITHLPQLDSDLLV